MEADPVTCTALPRYLQLLLIHMGIHSPEQFAKLTIDEIFWLQINDSAAKLIKTFSSTPGQEFVFALLKDAQDHQSFTIKVGHKLLIEGYQQSLINRFGVDEKNKWSELIKRTCEKYKYATEVPTLSISNEKCKMMCPAGCEKIITMIKHNDVNGHTRYQMQNLDAHLAGHMKKK